MIDEVIDDIIMELQTAEYQHPQWPKDIIHGVAIMAEESGEAVRAALNHVYHRDDIEELKKELIQTAAMCIRNLVNLEG